MEVEMAWKNGKLTEGKIARSAEICFPFVTQSEYLRQASAIGETLRWDGKQ